MLQVRSPREEVADAVDVAEYAESVAQQVQGPGSLGTGTPTSRSSIERWGSTVGTPGENLVAAHKKVKFAKIKSTLKAH